MNTKTSSPLFATLLAFFQLAQPSLGATFGRFTYTDTGTSITINDYQNDAVRAVDIPSTIHGKPVTAIGGFYDDNDEYNGAFHGCTNLASISIPDSVTSIGEVAFHGCTGLTSVSIGSSVKSIGSRAFSYCTGLTSISIPKSVTSIGNDAFSGCSGLTSISIPKSVTSIGNGTFSRCTGLTSFSIPSNVTSIGDYAFAGCTSLPNIAIPKSVTSIGIYAFQGCTSLAAITVDARNSTYSSWDGALFNMIRTVLIQYPKGKSGSYTIPNGVTSIGNGAFSGCTDLTSISIPNFVTSIGNGAFSGCTGLTNFSIPNSVTSIGDYAFSGCTGLTIFSIPNNVTSIGDYAFSGCTGLTSFSIPNNVTSIGDYAFFECTSLTSVSIPNNVASIGNGTFSECSGLASFSIPNTVTSIGNDAFHGCNSLTSISISDSVTSIGDRAFSYCTGLTSFSIPNSVTSIADETFSRCASLTSISIPDSVTSIGSRAFSYCIGLTSISIPKSVTSIGNDAFSECSGQTAITVDLLNSEYCSLDGVLFDKGKTKVIQYPMGKIGSFSIPDSVTSIGEGTFSNCAGLTSVSVPMSVTSIGIYAFQGCTSLTAITVDARNSVYCSLDGVLFKKNKTWLIQYPGGKTGSYSIPKSVTSIGNHAFTGCSGLTAITVDARNPEYSSLDGVLFDKSKTRLIQYPTKKTGIYAIPKSVRFVSDRAFSNCGGLSSIYIPSSVKSIGHYAFYNSTLIKAVFLGDAPLSMGQGVFDSCTSGFSVHYLKGKSGFASPTWMGYPSFAQKEKAEIVVQQPAGSNLADGVSSQSFGSVALGSTVARTFTIWNTGTANLTIPALTISGADAKYFTVKPPPRSSLAPGNSTRFKVIFKPESKGIHEAVIHIKSNDNNENRFDIAVTGRGTTKAVATSTLASVTHSAFLSAHDTRQSIGTVQLSDGRKYLTLTVMKSPGGFLIKPLVEVSPNLVDWQCGKNHTTVITDNASLFKVRDNTPLTPGTKRYIRPSKSTQPH